MRLARNILLMVLLGAALAGAGAQEDAALSQSINPGLTLGKLQTPPLPQAKSPVALFRSLLAMNRQEREEFFKTRTPVAREQIAAKVREYEAISPEQRELRLRVTELRYYLLPLMHASLTNRTGLLALVPEEFKPMIELRLQSWDQLSPEKQRDLLEREKVMDMVFRTPESQNQMLTQLPREERNALEEGLKEWQQLNQSQRDAIKARFEEYFGLTAREKEKVLDRLSDQEKVQIEKTLGMFDTLDGQRRAQCLRALDKFCRLSAAERLAFTKNAERWKLLKPEERKAWRNLVMNISHWPPLPPGMNRPPFPPVPPPPMPVVPSHSRPVATNG